MSDSTVIQFMLFNVETRRLLPSKRWVSKIEDAENQTLIGEGDDEGKLSLVLGWHDDADSLWVDYDGNVVSRDDNAPPLVIPAPPPPRDLTADDVWREKDRRLALGFDYDFGDERGVHHIGATASDMDGWDEVAKWANTKLTLDQPDATTTIATDTGPATITPMEWYSIQDAAATHRQTIWQASFVLAAMDPIPDDYASDVRWTI